MSDRVKHESRESEHSSGKHKKKKSRKHSSCNSSDSASVTNSKDGRKKEKKLKSKHRRRNLLNSIDPNDSYVDKVKFPSGRKNCENVDGELREVCRNTTNYKEDDCIGEPNSPRNRRSETEYSHKRKREYEEDSRDERSLERPKTMESRDIISITEGRVLSAPTNEKERSRKRETKDRSDDPLVTKKSKKSRKQRSSSRSNSSSDGSSSESTSSTSSSSSGDERRKKRRKKKKRAKLKKIEKKRKEERRKLKKIKERSKEPLKDSKELVIKVGQDGNKDRLLDDINIELADRAKAMVPMTKEEWEKKQSIIRRVYDAETGRNRLIKGDGEILEEIVSRNRHMKINKQATKGDGDFFQSRLRIKN